jgi:hypothetical protein
MAVSKIPFYKLWHDFMKDPDACFSGRLLALDPGETTGWSVWDVPEEGLRPKLLAYGQLPNIDAAMGTTQIEKLIDKYNPTHAVCEDYKVYAWKSATHSWASLHTPKLIGGITYLCATRKIPLKFQMAQQAKVFVTDEKMQAWGWWIQGQKHCRDSIRHALTFLMFSYGKPGK